MRILINVLLSLLSLNLVKLISVLEEVFYILL
jgi:hypothetical protein